MDRFEYHSLNLLIAIIPARMMPARMYPIASPTIIWRGRVGPANSLSVREVGETGWSKFKSIHLLVENLLVKLYLNKN
ncbi:MAG: hypothetical protein A2106_02090 [Planctomycetes bacterium GWF2_40_8]|nr:MAG: hypothetical protein A2106_02090 [Planctomycetes bacterium GWF2_40_8]